MSRLPFSSHRNSRKQGDAGLGAAICFLMGKGYTVSLPLSESQDYDLIVDFNDGSSLGRVQVKTTRHKNTRDAYIANLRVFGGNRSGTGVTKSLNIANVDYIFVLTDDASWYWIPTSTLSCLDKIVLNSSRDYQRVKDPDNT